MKSLSFLCLLIPFFIRFEPKHSDGISTSIIAKGQMPNLAIDKLGNAHLVYGSGDSIMYEQSIDGGKIFSAPSLIGILPGLYTYAMRGSQIACTLEGLTILASNKSGNIYSYKKNEVGRWARGGGVNDVDTVAKEGLMA